MVWTGAPILTQADYLYMSRDLRFAQTRARRDNCKASTVLKEDRIHRSGRRCTVDRLERLPCCHKNRSPCGTLGGTGIVPELVAQTPQLEQVRQANPRRAEIFSYRAPRQDRFLVAPSIRSSRNFRASDAARTTTVFRLGVIESSCPTALSLMCAVAHMTAIHRLLEIEVRLGVTEFGRA